jgi:hypothetical protein
MPQGNFSACTPFELSYFDMVGGGVFGLNWLDSIFFHGNGGVISWGNDLLENNRAVKNHAQDHHRKAGLTVSLPLQPSFILSILFLGEKFSAKR